MAHFLLIYDREAGTLIRQEEFSDGPSAISARFLAEREFTGRREIEVVAVAAQSEEELHATHGRYFLGLGELAARLN